MASSTLISVSEYLSTTYRPDRDYIDGELRERTLGERPHAALQSFFARIFGNHRADWDVRALIEQRVQTSATHYRIADVCVRLLGDPNDPIVRVAPLLCIEILSRGDSLGEMQERVDDYAAMGIAHIWIIDPLRRIAYIGSTNGFRRIEDNKLAIPDTNIAITLSEVFAELDDLDAGR